MTATAADKAVTGTQSIDRAADLLLRVIDADAPVTLTELVGATGLAKGTTSRILSALERAGLIERSPRGGFEPGPVLNNFAIRGGAYASLIGAVTPAMEQVAEITRETVSLAVATPRGLNSVAQVDGTYLLGSRNWVGQYVPLHASAGGKVLLAFGVASVPAALDRLTESTVTERAALDRDLRAVRDRGYGVIRNELEPGLVSVAVPVRVGGSVVAAMSVTGPGERITEGDEPHIAHSMTRSLQLISMNTTHEGAA